MTSFICSLKVINVVVPDLSIVLWIAASVAYAAVVNPNGIKTLLANGFNTFFIKDSLGFSKSPKNIPPNCNSLCNSVFENFILADETFAKALQNIGTCVLFNNNYAENYSHH